jgi:DNA-binding CsgD family transcriptional regulator
VILGRNAEVCEVTAALAEPGLVVLAGGPGSGKSAVAWAALRASGRQALAGGGLATLRRVPGVALSRAVRCRLPADDPALAAEAVRARLGSGVLLLDDVHWADRLTLDVLPELARRCRVVATLRTPSPLTVPALDQLRRAATCWLDLGPLATDAAAELARRVWAERGTAPDEAGLPALLDRAGGNPLAVRLLAAGGPPEAGAVHTVAAMLAELPQPERTALAALGLLGRPATPALLGPGVPGLRAAGLLAPADGDRVAATERFVAEVAAGVLPPGQRRELHRRLAGLLADDAEAAAHLVAAGEHRAAADRAARAGRAAGTVGARAELLLLAAAHDPALRLAAAEAAAEAGLDGEVVRLLSGPGPPRPPGDTTATDGAAPAGGRSEADGTTPAGGTPEASGSTGVSGAAVPEVVLLAGALTRCGEPAAAGRLLREVAPRVPAELREAHAAATVSAALGEDPEVACALAEYAGAAGQDAGPRLVAAYGLALLAAGRSGWEPALRRALAASAGAAAGEWPVAAALVAGLREACRTAEAAAVAGEYAERCAAQAAYSWEIRFRAAALWAALQLHGVADPVVRQAGALLDRAGPADARGLLAATVGLANADTGMTAAARGALAETPSRLGSWVAAEAAWLAGHPAEAVGLAAALAPGLTPGQVPGRTAGQVPGQTAARAGDLAADLAAITAAWAAADLAAGHPGRGAGSDGALVTPPAAFPGAVRQVLATALQAWSAGDLAGAARAWSGAMVREQVRCLLAAGTRDGLLEAERLAGDAGLTMLLGRVRRGLRRHGVVRRPDESPATGLSPREYEVLRLVGRGLPTHRIGELLGISRHTAEGYIKQAMGKLGARTRTEAAVRAAGLER